MLNFKNISPNADFYSKLDILNKNVLYVTHQTDKILKLINRMVIDTNLQNTVDKYFDEDEGHTPKNIPMEDMAHDGDRTDN